MATWLPKTRAACLMPLAAPRIGAVHVPINPVLKRAQAAYILADSGARLLVAGEGRVASLEPGDLPAACDLALESQITADASAELPVTRRMVMGVSQTLEIFTTSPVCGAWIILPSPT